MPESGRFTLSVVSVAVIGLVLALCVFLYNSPVPEYNSNDGLELADVELPVAWSADEGSGIEFPGPVSLLLREDGTAELVNVPEGHWERTDRGICWRITGGYFTGTGSWTKYSERGVNVVSNSLNVVFWAEPGKFGSYTWSDLKMVTCDDNSWVMSLQCGTAGGVTQLPCRRSG